MRSSDVCSSDLHWSRERKELLPIECNGMLFGVLPDAEYPVRHIPLKAGDRFLLYTDGLTEAENERGESFGERQLPTLMRMNSSRSAQEFVGCVLPAFKAWQRASSAQED